MLILSIILAAFAPVMTTRSKSDRTSPWRYATNNSDIYFGLGENQTAMIGQPAKGDLDIASRLIINTSDDEQKHIVFKRGAQNVQGAIQMADNGILLGSIRKGKLASGTVALGYRAAIDGQSSIAIGKVSSAVKDNAIAIGQGANAENKGAIAIGSEAEAKDNQAISLGSESSASEVFASAYGYLAKASGKNSTAIGAEAKADADETIALNSTATGKSSTAIGYGTAASEFSLLLAPGKSSGGGQNKSESSNYASIAIGSNTHSTGSYAIGIGTGANSKAQSALAIGTGAVSPDEYSIAVGNAAGSYGKNSIAIGREAYTYKADGIALGNFATASAERSIAIGGKDNDSKYATASGSDSVAVGHGAEAKGLYSIAFGSSSKAKGSYNVSIGKSACENVSGSNKICIGANSGPSSNNSYASSSDSQERIFIGSQSKFNSGVSVLEVHNTSETVKNTGSYDGINASGVVINGALIVKGPILGRAKTIGSKYTWGGNNWSGILEEAYTADNNTSIWSQGNWVQGHPLWMNSDTQYKPSDRRLKYVGSEVTAGLDKIKQLRVFDYTFKKDEKKTPHVGVIAQDLQKVFPDAVTKNDDGFLTIRMEDMFYALINAVKELDAKVTQLIKKDRDKDAKIKALETKNAQLEARLKRLETKIK